MTKAQAEQLQRQAEAAGFVTGIGKINRGRWYLSVRHQEVAHWAFTVLSVEQYQERLRAAGKD